VKSLLNRNKYDTNPNTTIIIPTNIFFILLILVEGAFLQLATTVFGFA